MADEKSTITYNNILLDRDEFVRRAQYNAAQWMDYQGLEGDEREDFVNAFNAKMAELTGSFETQGEQGNLYGGSRGAGYYDNNGNRGTKSSRRYRNNFNPEQNVNLFLNGVVGAMSRAKTEKPIEEKKEDPLKPRTTYHKYLQQAIYGDLTPSDLQFINWAKSLNDYDDTSKTFNTREGRIGFIRDQLTNYRAEVDGDKYKLTPEQKEKELREIDDILLSLAPYNEFVLGKYGITNYLGLSPVLQTTASNSPIIGNLNESIIESEPEPENILQTNLEEYSTQGTQHNNAGGLDALKLKNLTNSEIRDLIGLAFDLGSIPVSYAGPAGMIGALVMGLGSTGFSAYNDFTSNNPNKWGNLTANLGLDVVSAIPWAGTEAGIAKVMKNLVKFGPMLYSGFDLLSNGKEYINAFERIKSGKYTSNDFSLVRQGIMELVGTGHGVTSATVQKVKANNAPVVIKTKNAQGKIIEKVVPGEIAKKIQANPEKASEILTEYNTRTTSASLFSGKSETKQSKLDKFIELQTKRKNVSSENKNKLKTNDVEPVINTTTDHKRTLRHPISGEDVTITTFSPITQLAGQKSGWGLIPGMGRTTEALGQGKHVFNPFSKNNGRNLTIDEYFGSKLKSLQQVSPKELTPKEKKSKEKTVLTPEEQQKAKEFDTKVKSITNTYDNKKLSEVIKNSGDKNIPLDLSWERHLKVNFDAYVREQIKNGVNPSEILKRINSGEEIIKWWKLNRRKYPVLKKEGGSILKFNLGGAPDLDDSKKLPKLTSNRISGNWNYENNKSSGELDFESEELNNENLSGNYVYSPYFEPRTKETKVWWADPTITGLELSKFITANALNARMVKNAKKMQPVMKTPFIKQYRIWSPKHFMDVGQRLENEFNSIGFQLAKNTSDQGTGYAYLLAAKKAGVAAGQPYYDKFGEYLNTSVDKSIDIANENALNRHDVAHDNRVAWQAKKNQDIMFDNQLLNNFGTKFELLLTTAQLGSGQRLLAQYDINKSNFVNNDPLIQNARNKVENLQRMYDDKFGSLTTMTAELEAEAKKLQAEIDRANDEYQNTATRRLNYWGATHIKPQTTPFALPLHSTGTERINPPSFEDPGVVFAKKGSKLEEKEKTKRLDRDLFYKTLKLLLQESNKKDKNMSNGFAYFSKLMMNNKK